MSVGVSIGFTSPFLPILQSNESPLSQPLTESQANWVGSLFALGALFGTLIFGWLSEAVGRFWSTLLSPLPEIVRFLSTSLKTSNQFEFQLWWLIAIFTSTPEFLLLGRFLSGLTAGGVFVLVPLYISEISEDTTRGILGSFFLFSINIGTLLMFVAGSFMSYSVVPRIMISLPIIFALTFAFLPETPQYLLMNGKAKKAESSLKFLRGCKKEKKLPEKVQNEFLLMSKKVEEDSEMKFNSIFSELSKTPQGRSRRRQLNANYI